MCGCGRVCAGLVFRIFPVALTHGFKWINSVRKSRPALFFPIVLVIWKESHVVLCLLLSSPINLAFPSSHWCTFHSRDAGESSLAYNAVPLTLCHNEEVNWLWQSTEQKSCISWPEICHETVKEPTSRVGPRDWVLKWAGLLNCRDGIRVQANTFFILLLTVSRSFWVFFWRAYLLMHWRVLGFWKSWLVGV